MDSHFLLSLVTPPLHKTSKCLGETWEKSRTDGKEDEFFGKREAHEANWSKLQREQHSGE
ncbi:hypothetical protein F511_08760 [Dorcoceras hygrometricum]|uniref:Uncharacterized protein n=1 Tax=Dorcoceras hygrometricum TaxID=472368 RepID=A0A2Z7AJJ4_9LAMI|nr:hypothetical protein F511_08760 [Dorcoceras hygrometricum]